MDKKLFEELLDTKLAVITDKINSILSEWHYNSIELFLKHATDGTIEEAESDAISMTNLVDRREEIYRLKNKHGLGRDVC